MYYNLRLKPRSRYLRKNSTEAEKLLWSRLRRKQLNGYQFYRQRIIGSYIADFYCPKACLVIEVDGGQHYESEYIKRDEIRDEYLTNNGLRVLRFSDKEVFENTDGVIQRIYENL